MIVMMIASTPSLNASSRFFCMGQIYQKSPAFCAASHNRTFPLPKVTRLGELQGRFPFHAFEHGPALAENHGIQQELIFINQSGLPASITPALTNSSLNLPIAVSNSVLGNLPASESLVALTITMNLIVV